MHFHYSVMVNIWPFQGRARGSIPRSGRGMENALKKRLPDPSKVPLYKTLSLRVIYIVSRFKDFLWFWLANCDDPEPAIEVASYDLEVYICIYIGSRGPIPG